MYLMRALAAAFLLFRSRCFARAISPEKVGNFTAPYDERVKLGKPVIDRESKHVRVAVPDGVTLTAVYPGTLGCVTLPVGNDSFGFVPVKLKSLLPNAPDQAWPMGDVLPSGPPPRALDMAKVKEAVDAAFASPDSKNVVFISPRTFRRFLHGSIAVIFLGLCSVRSSAQIEPGRLSFSLPKHPGKLTLARRNWKITEFSAKTQGNEFGIRAEDGASEFLGFLFLAVDGSSAQACRESVLKTE